MTLWDMLSGGVVLPTPDVGDGSVTAMAFLIHRNQAVDALAIGTTTGDLLLWTKSPARGSQA